MEEATVAATLVNDIQSNLAVLQIAGFAVTTILAMIGIFLASRAYAILNDARTLYWRSNQIRETARAQMALANGRRANADTINACARRQKIPVNRRKVV